MNNFGEYITPEQAFKLDPKPHTLEELQRLAEDDSMCQCEQEKVWKYAGCGLCFSCTTGEADASDDYELVPAMLAAREKEGRG